MDEKEFEQRSLAALQKLEASLRDVDGVEGDLADGILTLEFDDDSKFIVNSHAAAQQIWLSANMAASHFGWHPPTSSWRDTRTGAELFTELGRLVAEKLSVPVVLRDQLSRLIRKLKSGHYRLYSRKKNPRTGRRRNLGTFKSRKAAEKHERAVQMFKRRG